MTVDQNKEKVRHWFADIVRGGTTAATLSAELDAVMAPTFIDRDGPDQENSREALRRVLPGLLQAMPDLHFTIEHLIGEVDMVAIRLRGEATHSGELMGKPPTGKHITWTENELYRFKDGRMVESWGEGTLDEALDEIGLRFQGS